MCQFVFTLTTVKKMFQLAKAIRGWTDTIILQLVLNPLLEVVIIGKEVNVWLLMCDLGLIRWIDLDFLRISFTFNKS